MLFFMLVDLKKCVEIDGFCRIVKDVAFSFSLFLSFSSSGAFLPSFGVCLLNFLQLFATSLWDFFLLVFYLIRMWIYVALCCYVILNFRMAFM
jgi:hypothetical protein